VVEADRARRVVIALTNADRNRAEWPADRIAPLEFPQAAVDGEHHPTTTATVRSADPHDNNNTGSTALLLNHSYSENSGDQTSEMDEQQLRTRTVLLSTNGSAPRDPIVCSLTPRSRPQRAPGRNGW
jgi:hypothetical protein